MTKTPREPGTYTVILEDRTGKELARCRRPGNERYLVRRDPRFPLLFNLDMLSYDVFSQSDATQLHAELLALIDGLQDDADRGHVREIAQLAFRAANLEGATITFTPFSQP